jgi:hypothetical protein
MPYFPNTTLKQYSYSESAELDEYGNPIESYVFVRDVRVDFQQASEKDRLTSAGELLQDTYRIFMDINLSVEPNDIFKDNNGDTYTIIGSPVVNNRFVATQHKKIVVQKTNKPIKMEDG